jgi:hypothetical protein
MLEASPGGLTFPMYPSRPPSTPVCQIAWSKPDALSDRVRLDQPPENEMAMALPVIADVFRCVFEQHIQATTDIVNVFHVRSTTLTTAEVADELVTNTLSSSWGSQRHNSWGVDKLLVTPLGFLGPTEERDMELVGAGSSGQALPHQCAMVMTLRTAVRSRRARGRQYLAGWAENATSSSDGSTWVAATRAGAQVGFELWIEELATAGVFLSVASYVAAEARDVTNVQAQEDVFTQRRRVL